MIVKTQGGCVFGGYTDIEWQADSDIGEGRQQPHDINITLSLFKPVTRGKKFRRNANNSFVFCFTRLYGLRTFNSIPKMKEIEDCRHQIGRFVDAINFYPPIGDQEHILGSTKLERYYE